MIDIHTHILAGVDDGPSDIEISQLMIQCLANQNVGYIGLTPHYYHYEQPLEAFLSNRDAAVELIRPFSDELGVVLLPGSETHLTDDLLNERDIKPLCIKGTRLLLTEMPFNCAFTKKDLFLLERFIGNNGIIPILAHVERYPPLMNSEKLIESLMEMGCLTQISISALSDGKRSAQKRIKRFITNGYVHFIGTDCHHMDYRAPEYARHISLFVKKLGSGFVEQFQASMARWLRIDRCETLTSEGTRNFVMKRITFVFALLLMTALLQLSVFANSKQGLYDLFVESDINYSAQFKSALRDFLNTNYFTQQEIDRMHKEVMDIKHAWNDADGYISNEALHEITLEMVFGLARGASATIYMDQTYNGWTLSVESNTGRVYTFVNLETFSVDPLWVEASADEGFLNPIKATGPGLNLGPMYRVVVFAVALTVALVVIAFRIDRREKNSKQDLWT